MSSSPVLHRLLICSVLAGLVTGLAYQPISSYGDGVLEGIALASTFWPFGFSAVLDASIRTIALFKAERGTKLSVSDQPDLQLKHPPEAFI